MSNNELENKADDKKEISFNKNKILYKSISNIFVIGYRIRKIHI